MSAAKDNEDGERYFRITASQLRKLVDAKIRSTQCMRPECMQYHDFCYTFIHKTAVFFDEIYKQFAEQDKLFIELLTIINKICTNFALQMHFKLPYSSFERKKKIHEVAVMLKALLNKIKHFGYSNGSKHPSNSNSNSSEEGGTSVNTVAHVTNSTSVLKTTIETRKRKLSSSSNACRTAVSKTLTILGTSAELNLSGPSVANENAKPAATILDVDIADISKSGRSNTSPLVTSRNGATGQSVGGVALTTSGPSLTTIKPEASSNKNYASSSDEVLVEIDTCSALAPLLNLLSPQKIAQSPTLQPRESSSLSLSTSNTSLSRLPFTSATSSVDKSNCNQTIARLRQSLTPSLRSKMTEVRTKGSLHVAPLSGREYIAKYPILFDSSEHPLPFSKLLFPTVIENHTTDIPDAPILRSMNVRLSCKSNSCIVKIGVDYSFAAFDQKLYFYYYLANMNANPWLNGQTFCCTKVGKLSMEMHIEDFVENELLMVSTRIAAPSLQYISQFSIPVAIRLSRMFAGIDVNFDQIALTRQTPKLLCGGSAPQLTNTQKIKNSVIEVIDLE